MTRQQSLQGFGWLLLLLPSISTSQAFGQERPEIVSVEAQPLAANVERLLRAFDFLGRPFPQEARSKLSGAAKARNGRDLQTLLDSHVLCVISINPESRVKAARGPAKPQLQQHGFTPCVVKIINEATVTQRLRVRSPQAGPVYSGPSLGILKRQAQTELKDNENVLGKTDRFLAVEVFERNPMTRNLSGLEVEYAILLIYSSEAGKREATLGFDVGQGTEDLGFRGELPVLFDVKPSKKIRMSIRDVDNSPTTARLLFTDKLGHVYPPQAKRVAPDFFFQKAIYRRDGDHVLLPPGELTLQYSRGPEYRVLKRTVRIASDKNAPLELRLERWVDPSRHGFYGGDHHIHAAGCSHYTSPSQGVRPEDMFLQVQGEGLNVGCVLTWGPCFDHQRQFFGARAHELSEPKTVLKYDLEISGFGSQALGHVCLLDLKNQTYPGSDGSKSKGWPTWTTPVLRWAKKQGGVTGYAHSASGLHIDSESASERLLAQIDSDRNGFASRQESREGLLPEKFDIVDADGDEMLNLGELRRSVDRAADQLPNFAIPEMNGVGAMEICVSAVAGVCDFISSMDTARIQEWNTWYHLLNCGFDIKVSGETDFPCMSSTRVGQGRVYVQLGKVDKINFTQWCRGIAEGRSYVSDGFAHALRFSVNGVTPGPKPVRLAAAGGVQINATVSFSPETPLSVAQGGVLPSGGRRLLGDTVHLHGPRHSGVDRRHREVEIVVNGTARKRIGVPADGEEHSLSFEVEITESSWVALRQFPQLHTNPVTVLIGNKAVLTSARSARWCLETIKLLWKNRGDRIDAKERAAAREAFDRAEAHYRKLIDKASARGRG